MGLLKNSGQWSVVSGQLNESRRRWLIAATQTSAFCLLPSAFCLLPSAHSYAQSADAWPQFRGNYNLTGVSPAKVNANLKQLWSLQAGEIIESSAAIADNTVYVGTGSSELIAVDLASGKLKWKYKTS